MQVPELESNEEEETPGFLQKGTKKALASVDASFRNPYVGAGFIDPDTMKVNKVDNTKMRFKQFEDPMFQFNNVNYSVSYTNNSIYLLVD